MCFADAPIAAAVSGCLVRLTIAPGDGARLPDGEPLDVLLAVP